MADGGTGIVIGAPYALPVDMRADTRLSLNVRALAFSANLSNEQHPEIHSGFRADGNVATYPERRTGLPLRDHCSAWYDNIILSPSVVNVGTIISNFEFDLVVWNSGFAPKTFSVVKRGWDGIEDNIPSSVELGPLCWRSYHLVVTMDGPSSIGAFIEFLSGDDLSLAAITGLRGVFWGFRPDRGLREIWEWKTEIQTAWDFSEQRLALRDVPRLRFELSYALPGAQATQADMMLYDMAAYTFSFPRFEQAVRATVHAGDEAVACDLSYSNWKAGDIGLLWKSPRKAELFTVGAVGSASLQPTQAIVQEFGEALVMPCTYATLDGDITRSDRSISLSDFSVTFLLADPPDWGIPQDSEIQQMEGHDVWEIPLYVQGGTFARSLTRPCVTLDNGLGPVKKVHAQPTSTGSWKITIPCGTLEEIMTVRGWILRRQGCVRPFWLSSGRKDFIPVATLRAGSQTLVVQSCFTGMNSLPLRSLHKRLRIEMVDGTVLYRTIQSLVANDETTDNVRLSEALDKVNDIPASRFRRISFLTLVRLSSDRVEWTWQRTDRAEVSFAVQEVVI